MEVREAKLAENLKVKGGKTAKVPAKVETKPPLLENQSVRCTKSSVQPGPSCEDDDLERLYESRKTGVCPPAAVRPKESPPQPADVPCRPPDPLYVRRVGQRFWSTKRILDWQRQALIAMECTDAVLKPVREYGEECPLKNTENGEVGLKFAYKNGEKHRPYENDGEHLHYENDEKHGHDPEFLALQDAIQDATAQPFYEMDIPPTDEEQEQPFYKMDATAAKDKEEQEQPFYKMDVTAAKGKEEEEQPFYEMEAASADEKKEQQPFYDMKERQLGQPTSENVYADLDPEFVAAQDDVCRRHQTGQGRDEGTGDDTPRCSQNCREFFRSRPGRVLAVSVGVAIAVTVATLVAVVFNQHSRLRSHHNESMAVDLTTITNSTTFQIPTTSPAHLPVTSPSTSETTDWWTEWTLYIRDYFQQDSEKAAGLEQHYHDNEVVMALLEDRFFWPWVCRYWDVKTALPHTLSDAVRYCIIYWTSNKSHGFSAYNDFLTSMLNALKALPNMTNAHQNRDVSYISLSGTTLSDNDVVALGNLFPYLRGMYSLQLSICGLSAKAATSLARQLHLLHKLTDLRLNSNNIGDDGVEAISETFPHLKELRTLEISKNSITNEGGRAMAKTLVHLQELQRIDLTGNELALSLSSLANAFVNMTRLQNAYLWPVTCRTASFRMAAQQAHVLVQTLEGQVNNWRGVLLYGGSTGSGGSAQGLGTSWQRVEKELTAGVHISTNKRLKMSLQIKLLEK
ncbi:uncharacterized protein LOC118431912 [Branchiostoma floridae]|uniref:Uncharacterized protein LOC118431912 n=1 Tax=Branchiostoma floridae TaxID=7739 RepID=A0A9J7NAN8_BRAFL|nr:uncharacterized protein LOC118431912 [Branchiostoma floridae]